MAHDHSQSNGGVAGIQATSGESSPQRSDSPRSLDGDEMVDHVHGKDDGRALHDHQGGGGQMDQKMKDGLVSLGPEKTFGTSTSMDALRIVGGTESFPREDPTEEGTRNVKRRLVVPRRMRKMDVVDRGKENRGLQYRYNREIFY